MSFRPPSPATNADAARWIESSCGDSFGARVTQTVPAGFAAYARVLHPTAESPSMRWSEVAARHGRTMHALAQWNRIAAPPGEPAGADINPPMTGDLAAASLRPLCDILGRHTATPGRCWFAIWEGWGELNGSSQVLAMTASGRRYTPRSAPGEWQLDLSGVRLDLPHRRYHLFTGPLDEALRFGHWITADCFSSRSPNLFWPDDRAWCVATEIDFDSTLVGGTSELIAEILAFTELEAWPVGPDDSLAHDADVINAP